ncbi:MAG: ethanolamine utilization phosphate acetyltransferase EutD [Eubacteriales bacterium]|nr:ethanolamine utilization phosphate acetyltransferase EutD [Eubacteriales bacterium]
MEICRDYDAGRIVEAVVRELKSRLMVEVEASGRHVHLCREDVEKLFGPGYRLRKVRELSQPGQFVCEERVTLSGPKGSIRNVVILGPERPESQAEISMTDSLALGIKPPVRLSGDIDGTPGFDMSVGDKTVHKDKGVIIAKRHMHITPEDAERLHVKDREAISIKVFGSRPVVFQDTIVRVSKDFRTYVHIDYDEANACGFKKGTLCRIIR